MIIFEIKVFRGKFIRLTETQWGHIISRHADMTDGINLIIETLEQPHLIFQKQNSIWKFYRFYPHLKRYIMVATKILNSEGFVITTYQTKRLRWGAWEKK